MGLESDPQGSGVFQTMNQHNGQLGAPLVYIGSSFWWGEKAIVQGRFWGAAIAPFDILARLWGWGEAMEDGVSYVFLCNLHSQGKLTQMVVAASYTCLGQLVAPSPYVLENSFHQGLLGTAAQKISRATG